MTKYRTLYIALCIAFCFVSWLRVLVSCFVTASLGYKAYKYMGSLCNKTRLNIVWISIILEVFFRKRIFLSFEVCLQTSSRVVEQPLAGGKTSYGVIWILKGTLQSRLYNPCIVPIIVLVKRHDQGLCSPSSEKQELSSLHVCASLCVNWWVFECLSVFLFELVNPFQSLHYKEHSSPLITHQKVIEFYKL